MKNSGGEQSRCSAIAFSWYRHGIFLFVNIL